MLFTFYVHVFGHSEFSYSAEYSENTHLPYIYAIDNDESLKVEQHSRERAHWETHREMTNKHT